jgi:hypothetical protein
MHHTRYHDPWCSHQGSAINVEQRLVASRGRALEMARARGYASLGFRINNQHFGVSGMLACQTLWHTLMRIPAHSQAKEKFPSHWKKGFWSSI